MQKRFEALTGIRAVAAIMVFLYHNKKYWRDWLPEMVIRNLNEFNAGVSIFFVLSGFLIAYTYQHKPLDSYKSYLQYLLTRFARIYPIFFILLTIQFLDYGFPKDGVNVWYDYSLIKGFSDVFNLDGIPQSWSLTVELSFYILAPFITYLLFKNKWMALAVLALLCCLVIGIGYWWKHINGNSNRWLYNWWFVMDGCFFGRFFEFYVGMCLAKLLLANTNATSPLSKLPKTWFGFVGTFVIIYCISFFERDIYHHGSEEVGGLVLRNFVLPLFVVLLLWGLITEKTWLQKLLSTSVMQLLGNASFLFYLIHIGYTNQKLASWFLGFDRNFVLLWVIAIVGYVAIEKPLYHLCKKAIQKI